MRKNCANSPKMIWSHRNVELRKNLMCQFFFLLSFTMHLFLPDYFVNACGHAFPIGFLDRIKSELETEKLYLVPVKCIIMTINGTWTFKSWQFLNPLYLQCSLKVISDGSSKSTILFCCTLFFCSSHSK